MHFDSDLPFLTILQVPPKRPSRTVCGCVRRCFDRIPEQKRRSLLMGFGKHLTLMSKTHSSVDVLKFLLQKKSTQKALTLAEAFLKCTIFRMPTSLNGCVKQHFCLFLLFPMDA